MMVRPESSTSERHEFVEWLRDQPEVDSVDYTRDGLDTIHVHFGCDGVPPLSRIADRAKDLGYWFRPDPSVGDDTYTLKQEP